MAARKQGNSYFLIEWLDRKAYPDWWWLRESNSRSYGFCTLCKSKISVANMGVPAIKSHAKGQKHKTLAKATENSSNTVRNYFFNSNTAGPSTATKDSASNVLKPSSQNKDDLHMPPSQIQPIQSKETTIIKPIEKELKPSNYSNRFALENARIQSEILWCILTTSAHISDRGAEKLSDGFSKLFPDSEIADKFTCKKDKHAYYVTFGLGPYLKDKLTENLKVAKYISLSFDEAFNKFIKRGQMDIQIRYSENESESDCVTIKTRYLDSVFLDTATAEDIFKALINVMEPYLNGKRLVSLSMDGPATNLKVLKLFNDYLDTAGLDKIIDLGTCSLHVIHGAVGTGLSAAGWDVKAYLTSTYYLFNGFPSRRGKYKDINKNNKESDRFPAKFCSSRWIENEHPAKVAIQILSNIKNFVESVKLTKSKTYKKVVELLKNPMIQAELGFFQGISHEVEIYLTKFQTTKPMVPFIYGELYDLITKLMDRFVKPEIMNTVKTAADIFKIDLNKQSNLLLPKDIKIYMSAKEGLKKCPISLSTKDQEKFRQQCANFLKATTLKLLERSPLKFRIIRGYSCLCPSIIIDSPKVGKIRCNVAAEELVKIGRIDGVEGDTIASDYSKLCSDKKIINVMKNFDQKTDSLDILYNEIFSSAITLSKEFQEFVYSSLVMFHGNADVERGFSINKQCVSDNMQEESLVARRRICE